MAFSGATLLLARPGSMKKPSRKTTVLKRELPCMTDMIVPAAGWSGKSSPWRMNMAWPLKAAKPAGPG